MPKSPNPDHIRRLQQVVNRSPFPELLSMRMADIGVGYAVMEIDVETKHMQLLGAVHGGVLATLIDTVTFWSVYYGIDDPDAWLTSVDLKLNYLAPAMTDKLIAKGTQKKIGKTLCYASAEVVNSEGHLLAHGASTLMILHDINLQVDEPMPTKFINEEKPQV